MTKFFGYKNNSMEDAMKNHNENKYVISLYDYTGEALKPWAEAGYIYAMPLTYSTMKQQCVKNTLMVAV